MRLAPGTTDVARFSRDFDEGRRLLTQGQPELAVRVLTDALELWRGEAFEDLPASEFIDGARSRLAELRELAVEERLAARLAAGDAQGAVSELDHAVEATPYRERRWELLILGLYRSGRGGEAVAALRRVRAQLTEDQGIGPGPELQELERRVLDQDPGLMGPKPARPASSLGVRSTGEGRGRRLSSFLGRAEELVTVEATLAGHRLVTVAGPAGVGKSRLAIEYLADRSEGDGSWLVRLAEVTHPGGIARAIAEVVGVAEEDADPRGSVIHALAARSGLLVLDNCEHLVDSVAELVIDLLESCMDLHVLATSRVHLGVDGETVVPVSPLLVVADDGSAGPAVALLLDRVRAVRPDWVPSAHEEASARRVAEALDGLPLALELAAARARLMGLDEIAERLDGHFGVLGTVPKGSLSPHTSLQAAIGWSVEQLPDADRALLVRLWPFDRGFSLEAAEAVCPSEVRVLESLSSLVARSVVVADTTVNPTRYRLLETLRAYCREHDPDPGGTLESHARRRRNNAERGAVTTPGTRSTGYAGTADS
ncbi:MAG TPA: BTAD domain-containing putative transcriptional regulator [Pseudonocardia sp.]|uniref:ATP-binding protein n=1 Tax=Pseudonocardia sp. TaxID=60912 RepID=UPI002ED9F751